MYPRIFGEKRMRWEQDLSGAGVSPRLGLGYDLATLGVASGIIVALLYILRLRDRRLEPERYLYGHAEDDRCT